MSMEAGKGITVYFVSVLALPVSQSDCSPLELHAYITSLCISKNSLYLIDFLVFLLSRGSF